MKTADMSANEARDYLERMITSINERPLINEAVEHPAHYSMGDIECIDGIKAALGENYIGFLIGNVIKYCWRYRFKGGLEDVKKAQYYVGLAVKELEHENK